MARAPQLNALPAAQRALWPELALVPPMRFMAASSTRTFRSERWVISATAILSALPQDVNDRLVKAVNSVIGEPLPDFRALPGGLAGENG